MSLWPWLALGVCGGALPSLAAQARYRAWWARHWWSLSFWIAFCLFILPFGIVLVMLLSAWDFAAIREMGELFVSAEFGWLTALALGWLAGSGVPALIHRQAPRLQGPPLSQEVMELARDPEKAHQAIQRYQQETEADFPVATDVVERFASQRAAVRQPWGSLEWMYSGFTLIWYVALSIGFGLSMRSGTDQANYFVVGLASFLFIPSLFAGFCGVCAGFVNGEAKADLRRALRAGSLTRRFAFLAGLMAGVVSIVGVLAVGAAAISVSDSEAGLWLALAGIGGVLIASPFLGLWLIKRSERSSGARLYID